VLVGDLDRVTFDDHVQPPVPGVAPGAEDHMPVAAQVDGLLLVGAGAEVQGAVGPHGDQWRHVRTAVGPYGGDPEQLGLRQRPAGLLPLSGGRGGIAESLIQGSYRGRHGGTSLPVVRRLASPSAGGAPVWSRRAGLPVII